MTLVTCRPYHSIRGNFACFARASSCATPVRCAVLQLRAKLQALPSLDRRIPATCTELEEAMADLKSEQIGDHPKQPLLRKLLTSLAAIRPVSNLTRGHEHPSFSFDSLRSCCVPVGGMATIFSVTSMSVFVVHSWATQCVKMYILPQCS